MGGETLTITQGVISGFADLNGLSWIKTDLMTGPGNSGAMVINSSGELIGIHTQSWSDQSQSSSRLAIERPINTVRGMIDAVLVDADDTAQQVAQVTESGQANPEIAANVDVSDAVQIFAVDESGDLYGACSGVMISPHGYLVTGADCLEQTQRQDSDRWVLGAGLPPNVYNTANQLYEAEIVRIDSALDVALLKITSEW